MSKTKELLIARKNELEAQLKGYSSLQKELQEVNTALAALEPAQCQFGCYGCPICRSGWEYR